MVSGVAEIMEVQADHADRLDGVRPGRHLVEVASPQRPAHGPMALS
jgi:hypothetical protein